MRCEEISKLMIYLGLGTLVKEAVQVKGGLLHRMYRVNSEKIAAAHFSGQLFCMVLFYF